MEISSRDEMAILSSSTGYEKRRAGEKESSSSERFAFQRVSLDAAVSPLLSRPTAPFDKTEQKRAQTCAKYYSECFLLGIEPIAADTAAEEAQGKYDKWWIKSTAHPHKVKTDQSSGEKRVLSNFDSPAQSSRLRKSRRMSEETTDERSTLSANVVSVSTAHAQGEGEELTSGTRMHDGTEQQPFSISQVATLNTISRSEIDWLKARIIVDLRKSGGSVETEEFTTCLEVLEAYYRSKSWDGRGYTPFKLDGNWLTLSKTTYHECRGLNEKGENKYFLGRLSFDMFKPTQLACSITATFNNVRPIDPRNPGRPLHVPRKLMKEIKRGGANLRTYE